MVTSLCFLHEKVAMPTAEGGRAHRATTETTQAHNCKVDREVGNESGQLWHATAYKLAKVCGVDRLSVINRRILKRTKITLTLNV